MADSTTRLMGLPVKLIDQSDGTYSLSVNSENLPLDTFTGSVTVITSDHNKIHQGEGFSISGIFASVANAATVNFAFKTPTVASGKYIHLKHEEFWGSGNKIRTDLYEAPTNAPTNGTDLTAINRNRTGTPTATAMQAIKSGMDVTLTGALDLETLQFGVGTAVRPLDIEYVLKPNTWYIRTFTNSTGGAADINFFSFWYEE